MSHEHVIVVAAGSGSRFGGDLPKQFCTLAGRPVLMQTVINIGRALPDADITIVLNSGYMHYWDKLCEEYGFVSPPVVAGGDTRWQSVSNAINSLDAAPGDIILVHDGVRPLVRKDMADRILHAMQTADAAIPAIPVTDSLRQIDGEGLTHAVDRSRLLAVQTPQAFRASKLIEAYRQEYRDTFTDDASVYESAGFGCPVMVQGSELNIKITNPRDIDVAALFMGVE